MDNDYPNLDHWKHVEEFRVFETALLMSQIDPYDYPDGVEILRESGHPRWKTAMGYQRAIVTAIARGTLAATNAYVIQRNYDGEEYMVDFDEATHTWADIDSNSTTVTRQSIYGWIKKQDIKLVLPPHIRQRNGEFVRAATVEEKDIIEISMTEVPRIAYAPYLDKNNELSPNELRAAVAAWEAVAEAGDPRLNGVAVKTMLKKWLTENSAAYGLGKDAIERCATVANWNKKGGVAKTPSGTPPSV